MADFPSFKAGDGKPIVYVRTVAVDELPEEVRAQVPTEARLFAIHDQNGQRLALLADRSNAFAVARANSCMPVSVH
jgi:hypothetical protein